MNWKDIRKPETTSTANTAGSGQSGRNRPHAASATVPSRLITIRLNRYLVEINVPDAVWAKAEDATTVSAPNGWDAELAGLASSAIGSDWAASKRSALLLARSFSVPEERTVLINSAHADAVRLTARKVRRCHYDPRMAR